MEHGAPWRTTSQADLLEGRADLAPVVDGIRMAGVVGVAVEGDGVHAVLGLILVEHVLDLTELVFGLIARLLLLGHPLSQSGLQGVERRLRVGDVLALEDVLVLEQIVQDLLRVLDLLVQGEVVEEARLEPIGLVDLLQIGQVPQARANHGRRRARRKIELAQHLVWIVRPVPYPTQKSAFKFEARTGPVLGITRRWETEASHSVS